MTTYKIADNQNIGEYFRSGEVFKNKEDIVAQLASFHDNDYSGEKGDNNSYKNIYEFLDTLKTTNEKLNWLLDYGDWSLEEDVIHCPLCSDNLSYKQNKDTHIWSCDSCPFVGFEFYNDKNTDELKEYLNNK